jgi:hypothetical protein
MTLEGENLTARISPNHLDFQAHQRHLATQGFATLLTDIARAAALPSAPFLEQDVTLAAARSQWSQTFQGRHANGRAGRRLRLRQEQSCGAITHGGLAAFEAGVTF